MGDIFASSPQSVPEAATKSSLALSSNSDIQDYIALLKPRVMSLVVFTGIAGMVLAPGASDMHPLLAVVAIFALALGSGAAGAVNMWYDRDIDLIMHRTANRPIPADRIAPNSALLFAVVCSVASIFLMGLATNWLAAGILAFANLYYSIFYTMWLKRRTPQNIVIGGAAGAFPPVIGWAMVSGEITLYPILLFLVIFFWTPPHFWALSLYSCKDYAKAGIPMLPVVAGDTATRRSVLAYSVILAAVSISPYFFGFAGPVFAAMAAGLNILFLLGAWAVFQGNEQNRKPAIRLFAYSIFYLFAYFTILLIEIIAL